METLPTPEDWGCTFTVADVADVLRVPTAAVLDLVRTGTLTAVVTRTGPGGPVRLLLHPDHVAAYARRRDTDMLTVDESLHAYALGIVRSYLRECPAVGDYDKAFGDDLPLWGAARTGRALHLREESVTGWHERVSSDLLTISALRGALEAVGAVRRRGVVPWDERGADGRQRWSWWWRVPSSLLTPEDEDAAARDVVAGVVEPGERLTRRGAGRPFLEGPLSPAEPAVVVDPWLEEG